MSPASYTPTTSTTSTTGTLAVYDVPDSANVTGSLEVVWRWEPLPLLAWSPPPELMRPYRPPHRRHLQARTSFQQMARLPCYRTPRAR